MSTWRCFLKYLPEVPLTPLQWLEQRVAGSLAFGAGGRLADYAAHDLAGLHQQLGLPAGWQTLLRHSNP